MSQAGFEQINKLASEKRPFLCLIDFDKLKPLVFQLGQIDPDQLKYHVNGKSNTSGFGISQKLNQWAKIPVSEERYRKAFDKVQKHLQHGDSFLLNLTFPTAIKTNLGLKEVFDSSQAKYRVWLKDRFVTFSPEPFVKIQDGVISSFPMKGTIRSSAPNAAGAILNDQKEAEEHLTIVDLIRNDLALVATNIQVEEFRYIEEVRTAQSNLLQVSSKINGHLQPYYRQRLGDLLDRMLPAGSISGAPKRKTVEIIKQVEDYERGFFTGIVGIFDGSTFDSGVMIRYIEQTNHGLVFKSGGGITVNSNWENEYREMIDKVYVPIV